MHTVVYLANLTMKTLRHLLALVLALQIANPLCHCVGDECCPVSDSQQQPSSACCSHSEKTHSDKQSNKSPHSEDEGETQICMCPKDPNLSHDIKDELPGEPHLFELLTPILVVHPDSLTLAVQAHPLLLSENLPPGGPPRRVLFASFLI